MGLSCHPRIWIADEPTTAVDVSVQAQILNLLKERQEELGLTFLSIAHNLAVVKYEADRVAIMYVGKIAELADTEELFTEPLHTYTEALLSAPPNPDPKAREEKKRIVRRGDVANPASPPSGCYFHPCCMYAKDRCTVDTPPPRNTNADGTSPHYVACHFAEELSPAGIPHYATSAPQRRPR